MVEDRHGVVSMEPFEEMMRAPAHGTPSLRDAMNQLLDESFIGPR